MKIERTVVCEHSEHRRQRELEIDLVVDRADLVVEDEQHVELAICLRRKCNHLARRRRIRRRRVVVAACSKRKQHYSLHVETLARHVILVRARRGMFPWPDRRPATRVAGDFEAAATDPAIRPDPSP
jgi:hypothetical protein